MLSHHANLIAFCLIACHAQVLILVNVGRYVDDGNLTLGILLTILLAAPLFKLGVDSLVACLFPGMHVQALIIA